MKTFLLAKNEDRLCIHEEKGCISSLHCGGEERVSAFTPLFRLCLRERSGESEIFSAEDATKNEGTLVFSGFRRDLTVRVLTHTEADGNGLQLGVQVENHTQARVEWVDILLPELPHLRANDPNGGELLLPYNEGAVIRDENKLTFAEPKYPSMGNYPVFPNMMFAQFFAYHFDGADAPDGCGLYVGAHDAARGVKGLWAEKREEGVQLILRLYCDADFAEGYTLPYPVVIKGFYGTWQTAAEIYRNWFESALPAGAKKIIEQQSLPEWYADSPVVVSYPVRGVHDMDEMKPNRLFPYENALPLIAELREKIDARILVLLMHWEGTAPWAPPYVWPPYGGEASFRAFMDELHAQGDLMGVYCSGFGYTMQSNLIAEYNNEAEYHQRGLSEAMCAGPDGTVQISEICTFQRSGYDICPASEAGKALLAEAYRPLLQSGVDYAQILDQNHGGSQYFCHSTKHGHPAGPGAWMTQNMQALLHEWNQMGGKMLLGCESAAAEPFIGNLQFSDNRYELCYYVGHPVPLYAYLYHEYVRNFMGNQVSCPFPTDVDTLRMRMAYSFAAGDCLTIVLTPDGDLMVNWGTRDFEHHPDREKTLHFMKNLMAFYREQAKKYLYNGKMIAPGAFRCEQVSYCDNIDAVPAVMSSAWQAADGTCAQILVNHTDVPQQCWVGEKQVTVEALSCVLLPI